MLAPLIQALTSRYAGPVASALALLLAAMLAISATSAARTEARLNARVAELGVLGQRSAVIWRARLAACESAGPDSPSRGITRTALGRGASAQAQAARLMREPAGFDVCARMEAADQAVLDSLK